MSNPSTDQMALAISPVFLARIAYLSAQQARVVLAETGIGGTHAKRALYAATVLANLPSFAPVIAVTIVGGINVIGTAIGTGLAADSSASDAAILSQIATFWNALAGIDTGS